jgi:hypothetical protein
MSTISLDEHIASTLTPEELEAINDVDATSSGDRASLERIAAGAEDDDETEVGGDPDEVLDADGNPVATTTEVAPAAKAPAAEDPPAEIVAPAAPTDQPFVFKSQLPDDFDQRVEALTAEEADIRKKFRDGDIDINEYDAQRDTLNARRNELNSIKIRADIADDLNRQTSEAREQSFETQFIASKAKDGLDYSADKNVKLFNAMLADVMEDNPKQPKEWHWNEAHKKALTVRGLAPAAEAPKPKPTPSRAPPVSAVPMTLAQVPGSDGPGDVGSEFANIDSLVGDELEDAIARMTPAQRAKFAAGR